MREHFTRAWIHGLALWGTLMIFFSSSRLLYTIDYWQALNQSPFKFSELIMTLLSAARFDCSISASFAAIVIAIEFTLIFAKTTGRVLAYATGLLLLNISIITIIADHFFYIYFKDHFNIFFFEFWEDLSNSKLVAAGVGDEINLPKAIAAFTLAIPTFSFLYSKLETNMRNASIKYKIRIPTFVSIVLLAIGIRGTLQKPPLIKQNERTAISSNQFINLLHVNAFIPMYRGWESYLEMRKPLLDNNISEEKLADEFTTAKAFLPDAVPLYKANYTEVQQQINPTWQLHFKSKPKNIVILFMESYSAWILDHPDEVFSNRISKNLKQLRKKGYYFSHYFPPAGGTMKNIIAAIYSIMLPRNLAPSFNYHREAYKAYNDTLPKLAKRFDLVPEFYYAGFAAWHRLYNFIPQVDFAKFFAEHSNPDLHHHRYGLFDGTMFEQINHDLRSTEEAKLLFAMSLSNHPPYTVPESFQDASWPIPGWMKERLLEDEAKFYMRFNAFRYSDQALGDFLRMAEKEDYFKETLFIITADHPFGGAITYPQVDGWREENIPLLFYAPHLLKEAYVGKTNKMFATHIDLLPTIAGITQDSPQKITTWGKNLLSGNDYPAWTGNNFYFSCIDRQCLKDNRVYYVNDNYDFSTGDQTQKAGIKRAEKAIYKSALRYVQKYQDSTTMPQNNPAALPAKQPHD